MLDELNFARDLARREVYALIAAATADPCTRERRFDDPSTQEILMSAIDLIRDDEQFHPASLGPGEIHPATLDLVLPPQLEAAIEADYAEVFGYCTSKKCPPYETEYCPLKDVTYRSQQIADVAGFYRAFGLKTSSKVHERVDHVSLETEFMSVLITREIYALHRDLKPEAAEVCREAQRTFFKEHLAWWLPALGARLSDQRAGFYDVLGKLICGFVPAERAILGVEPGICTPAPQACPSTEMSCG